MGGFWKANAFPNPHIPTFKKAHQNMGGGCSGKANVQHVGPTIDDDSPQKQAVTLSGATHANLK